MAEVGCVERKTSDIEYVALILFYEAFIGDNWRFNDNWLEGDPCINQWYGVGCNTEGNIISLFFFENHLQGVIPEEISDLGHLKHLSIFNGELGFQGQENLNANKVDKLPESISLLSNLEELNLAWVGLGGLIPENFTQLSKLRFLNLSNNELEGALPAKNWDNLQHLEMLELQNNKFGGQLPGSLAFMTELTYVNLSHNDFRGDVLILKGAQKLQGLELSHN